MSLVDWPSADAPPSVLLEQDDIIAEISSTISRAKELDHREGIWVTDLSRTMSTL